MSGNSESMIERVARAIYNVGRSGDELWTNHNAPDGPIAAIGLAEARAAIEAMREPTRSQVLASCKIINNADEDAIKTAIEQWQAMIAAALGDHP